MKSTFFSSFLVLGPTSDDFSMARSRFSPFYRPFSFPFSHFESKLRRFFEGTSLFSAPKLIFSLLHPVLPHASGTSSRDLTLYFPRTPFFTQREGFSDSGFPFRHPLLHLYLPIYAPSVPHPPLPSPLPHFLSHSSPLFHLSPQLTMQFARPRASRAYAYDRAHTHASGGFRFFSFTASPTFLNPLYISILGVKGNEKKPSQNAQLPHNQNINTKRPISSTVNFISSPR